jgi:REP element-mobilizing transposase RayT
VTIVTEGRVALFGQVVESEMRLNAAGEMLHRWWEAIPTRFAHVEIDAYVMMPNHMHGIIAIEDPRFAEESRRGGPMCPPGADTSNVGAAPDRVDTLFSPPTGLSRAANAHDSDPTPHASTPGGHVGPPLREDVTLSSIVQWFKTMTTNEYIRGVKTLGWRPFPGRLWQRSFYDHIIRDDRDAERMQGYIESNPGMWTADRENPAATRGANRPRR